MGRGHRDQSLVIVSYDARRRSRDEAAQVGAHRQYRVRARSGRKRQKAAYVAAKHGLVGLTKVVALETANDGITCNAICPGWVLTQLVQQQIEARAAAAGQPVAAEEKLLLSEKQPMHAFTTPESIGELTAFLCGDAARTITGASYAIDGGWTAA
jgi:3-hydroxybutyrate dehydrogenase